MAGPMSQESQTFIALIENFAMQHPEWWLAGGATIIVLLLVLLSSVQRHLRATAEQRKIKRVVMKTAVQFMPNIELPDEVAGAVHVDYLMLTPGGIIVIDVLNCRGILFGGEKIDMWSQLVGRKSYKFENPLPHNQSRVQTIKFLLDPKVPVAGRVVFSSAGTFAKGVPEGVSMIDTLQHDLAHFTVNSEVPQLVKDAWEKLRARATFLTPVKARDKDLF